MRRRRRRFWPILADWSHWPGDEATHQAPGLPSLKRSAPWALSAAVLMLVVALLLGGAARGPGDAGVHAAALLAFGVAAHRWKFVDLNVLQKTIFWLCVAAVLVGLAQLIPLPAEWFRRLPQRNRVLEELQIAGLRPTVLPMSLDLWGTVRSIMALLAFMAMWMLCTTLPLVRRVQLLKLAAAICVPMAVLGIAQATAKLDTTGANGLFTNRNHFATLMAMLLPACLVAAQQAAGARRRGEAMRIVWYGAAGVLLLGAALSFSRAGVVLMGVSVACALGFLRGRVAGGRSHRRGAVVVLGLAAVAVGLLAAERLAARFRSDLVTDLRWQYLENGLDALRAYLPWGSGLGSFRYVYERYEPAKSMGEFTYALYAHNELLHNAIEAGLPAIALMVAFAAVVAFAVIRLLGPEAAGADWARAAAIACVVVLLHSLVDYPLRTFACSTVFALALSIVVDGTIVRPSLRKRSPDEDRPLPQFPLPERPSQ